MSIKESAIKSCEARIKHLQNAPPYYYGKRQRLREIELEKVKIAALCHQIREEQLWHDAKTDPLTPEGKTDE